MKGSGKFNWKLAILGFFCFESWAFFLDCIIKSMKGARFDTASIASAIVIYSLASAALATIIVWRLKK